MKTAEEMLNLRIEEYNKTVNNLMKFQFNKKELMMFEEFAKEYASQAIDRCAEVADIDDFNKSEGIYSVSIKSILKVKSELK